MTLTIPHPRARWLDPGEDSGEGVPHPPSASTLASLRGPGVWLGMLTFFVYTGVELSAALWSFSLLTL